MSNSSETQSSKGITFSFTRKSKQQNLNQNKTNKFSDLETNDSLRTDFVTSIDDKQIQSTVKEVKKKELVIPLITTNRYRLKNDVNKQSKTQSLKSNDNKNGINEEKRSNDSLEDMAKEELLNEAKKWKEEPNETRIQSSRIIPVIDYLIQNRVPEGFETDDKFDVSLRPVEPNLDDYESVPVQEFGLAMLRGMGWKPGLKESYTPIEPQIRPKGLGLGAETSVKQQISKISQNITDEELQLKKRSFVCVEFGPHKGSYGIIEDFDDDLSRVTVKLTIKKESIKIPVALLRVVAKNEFQTESKVINKAKYEDYKKMENKSEPKHSSHSKDRHESDRNLKRSHNHIKTSNSDIKNERSSEDINKKHSTHNSWLWPNLKVRIIDKNYKNGKYYKEKVNIIDVMTPTKCCCKTYDKKLLDDIDLKMLETVIPRQNNSNIMILFGKYKQQLGLIVDRDKSRSEAKVQLLNDKTIILTLNYDQICEFSDQ